MRNLIIALGMALLLATSAAAQSQAGAPKSKTQAPPNPNIDMDAYLKIAQEAAEQRKTHRLTEEEFLKMSKERGTIVLDARSKEMYDRLHIQGAINLSFPNIDVESLKKTLPDKNARILIYCNNNFTGAPIAFAGKGPAVSLNLPTYIVLYNYGYRNVYELAPTIAVKESKLPWAGRDAGKPQ